LQTSQEQQLWQKKQNIKT